MLRVNEIYASIQGEGTRAGRPCTLIRLAGCNLRCAWCDTKHAYDAGRPMSLAEVLAAAKELAIGQVMVTGGEPLLQQECPALLSALCDAGHETLLMTNGSLDISGVDERVIRCLDVKCPASGQSGSALWPNLESLRASDEVKFVIAERGDYDFARQVIAEHRLIGRCEVILSVAAGLLAPAALAKWMLEDRLEARLGVQLHKLIWPDVQRGT